MKQAKSLAMAESGVDADGLGALLSAIIADIDAGRVAPKDTKAISVAIGKLQNKYKTKIFDGQRFRLWDSSTGSVPADFLTPMKEPNGKKRK